MPFEGEKARKAELPKPRERGSLWEQACWKALTISSVDLPFATYEFDGQLSSFGGSTNPLLNIANIFLDIFDNNNDNNNNSQCGSSLREVWGDPVVGNLTPTGISTHKEVDSLRPTKKNLKNI